MQVVGVRVTSYVKKFTHFNYFGASCRHAGEWTVIHLSVHICFLASTFFTNIPSHEAKQVLDTAIFTFLNNFLY